MKSGRKILVIGSSNTDMVIKCDHFPRPGETILGGRFFMNPGGKGANQAVAAARLGGDVTFVTSVGMDIFGEQTLQNLLKEGIDMSGLIKDENNPSGVAMITVDKHAENSIVVASGANMGIRKEDIDRYFSTEADYEILLMQLEIPMPVIEYAAEKAVKRGVKVILNPAPAAKLTDLLYSCLYLVTPNETETEFLTGIRPDDERSAVKAADFLRKKGVKNVIITLGASGAFVFSGDMQRTLPAPRVNAVDTTAAGDTFSGALAVALSEGKDIERAVNFANRAAARTVTKMGAQSSIPYLSELKDSLVK